MAEAFVSFQQSSLFKLGGTRAYGTTKRISSISIHMETTQKRKGHKLSPESIQKMLQTRQERYPNGIPVPQHLTKWRKERMSGPGNPGWRGGVSAIGKRLRREVQSTHIYTLWRTSVLLKDNEQCVLCGSKDKLEVDHIKSFAAYPEFRFAIDNGRTLCQTCHISTPNYGSLALN